MMSPREGFQEIARIPTSAIDTLDDMPASIERDQLLCALVGAHTHALLQAATLTNRERAGALFAMPCQTETLQ